MDGERSEYERLFGEDGDAVGSGRAVEASGRWSRRARQQGMRPQTGERVVEFFEEHRRW